MKLSDEDYEAGIVWEAEKSMYGARDATLNWENAYSEFMVKVGLKRRISSPCTFFHENRN